MRTTDPEYLEGSYNIFREDFISVPYPTAKNLDAIMKSRRFAGRSPHAQTRGVRRPELCPELEKSGFIKKLYEGK